MVDNALTELTLSQLRAGILEHSISSEKLVSQCFRRIEAMQDRVNAFVCSDRDQALEQARSADLLRDRGLSNGSLHGIPIAVEDNYWTRDFPTTGCSRVHQDMPLGSDATAIAKLRQAGAIIVGKTNMHEWAMGRPMKCPQMGQPATRGI